MKNRCISLLLFAAATACSSAAQTMEQPTAAERIQAASAAAGLHGVNARPWHLKMDVTVFDSAGKSPQAGTIEVWSNGKDRRTVMLFGDGRSTHLISAGKRYDESTGSSIPYEAEAVLHTVMQPGPTAEEIKDSQPEVRQQKFGSVSMDCIMLSLPNPKLAGAHLGLFPTYCLGQLGKHIAVSYDFGTDTYVERAEGDFLGYQIPTKFDLLNGNGIPVAHAAVSSLTTFEPSPDEFDPAEGQVATTNTARVAGGVLAGAVVTKTTPVYPVSAKRSHTSGTVVLRAMIGTDGHVHSLRLIAAPDPDLAISAISAVREWTYKPYLLNGMPVNVDSTITVNFALR